MNNIQMFIDTFIEQILIVCFFLSYFGRSKKYSYAWIIVWILILSILFTIFYINLGHLSYYIIIEALFGVFPPLVILFHGNILEKSLISILSLEILSTITILVVCVISYISFGKIEIQAVLKEYSMIIYGLRNILFLLITQFIARLRRKMNKELSSSILYIFILFLAVTLCSSVAMEAALYKQLHVEQDVLILIITHFIGIHIFIIVFFLLMKIADDKAHIDLKLQAYQHQEILIEKIASEEMKIQQLQHDLKHLLLDLQYCMIHKKYEEGLAHINVYSKLQQLHEEQFVFTSNKYLNYILNYKYHEAKKKGVSIKYHVSTKHTYSIDNLELCVLLGNVIDNAIENTKANYIEVSLLDISDYLKIVVRNQVLQHGVLKQNPKLISTKKQKGHGFGLKSMHSICKKNEGSIKIYEEDNTFIVSILVK